MEGLCGSARGARGSGEGRGWRALETREVAEQWDLESGEALDIDEGGFGVLRSLELKGSG